MKILWQIYKHLSAIVHDILIAFLSFYIHLGYYENMAVCIYTSTDWYQYFYKWINNETHHQCHRYKIYRVFFSCEIFTDLPVSIGIFILQVLSLHNLVNLTCDNFNKYGNFNKNSLLSSWTFIHIREPWLYKLVL